VLQGAVSTVSCRQVLVVTGGGGGDAEVQCGWHAEGVSNASVECRQMTELSGGVRQCVEDVHAVLCTGGVWVYRFSRAAGLAPESWPGAATASGATACKAGSRHVCI
jgi:hypothetical protein